MVWRSVLSLFLSKCIERRRDTKKVLFDKKNVPASFFERGGMRNFVPVKKSFNNYKIMVNYKELGLVNTREMFKRAINGGYAIPAFNFNNMEQLQAIVKAAVNKKSPVILQVSKGARNYANQTLLRYMAEGAVEYAKELAAIIPKSCFTSITAIRSNSARAVSTWGSVL